MEKSYAAHVVGRIDLRYYLILINQRYYVVDYSDPAKISNYTIGAAANIGTEWTVYDVTGSENQITLKKVPFLIRYLVEIMTTIQISFIINGAFFPDIVNVSVWTHSNQIHQYWSQILVIIFVGLGLIVLILNIKAPPKLKFEKFKKYTLVQANNKHSGKKVFGYLFILFILISSVLFGVFGQNYGSLFVFGFLTIYLGAFYRFIKIRIGEPGRKYQIVEGEK